MTKQEYIDRFKKVFIEKSGFSDAMAEECADANYENAIENGDEDDPEEYAMEEIYAMSSDCYSKTY